nr:creatininase family protein [Limobrevibacterium gyesilva]
MTFREFEARIPDKPVILLPLGSQEEHGPTAPMGDFMLTDALAGRIAERADAIAAATLPFGYADYFRPIAGGIQLRAPTFCAVLRDFADNFLDHGLDRLVILNGHSGNAPLIDQVTRGIRRDTGVVVPSINLWRLHTPQVWTEAYGVPSGKGFGHGAEPVGSVYAHLFPDAIRPDLGEAPANGKPFMGFETAGFAGVRFHGIEIAMPLDVTDLTDNGIVSGDPTMCSPEAGRRIAEHIVATSADFVIAFRDACAMRAREQS